MFQTILAVNLTRKAVADRYNYANRHNPITYVNCIKGFNNVILSRIYMAIKYLLLGVNIR